MTLLNTLAILTALQLGTQAKADSTLHLVGICKGNESTPNELNSFRPTPEQFLAYGTQTFGLTSLKLTKRSEHCSAKTTAIGPTEFYDQNLFSFDVSEDEIIQAIQKAEKKFVESEGKEGLRPGSTAQDLFTQMQMAFVGLCDVLVPTRFKLISPPSDPSVAIQSLNSTGTGESKKSDASKKKSENQKQTSISQLELISPSSRLGK